MRRSAAPSQQGAAKRPRFVPPTLNKPNNVSTGGNSGNSPSQSQAALPQRQRFNSPTSCGSDQSVPNNTSSDVSQESYSLDRPIRETGSSQVTQVLMPHDENKMRSARDILNIINKSNRYKFSYFQ